MGMFDDYGTVQLKVGPCEMLSFKPGDEVPIPDGVYVAWGGVVVIHGGRFVGEWTVLTTKWGTEVDPGVALYAMQDLIPVAEQVARREKGSLAALRRLLKGIAAVAPDGRGAGEGE